MVLDNQTGSWKESNKDTTGFFKNKTLNPVTEKMIRISRTWSRLSTPHLSFSFFKSLFSITSIDDHKNNEIIESMGF